VGKNAKEWIREWNDSNVQERWGVLRVLCALYEDQVIEALNWVKQKQKTNTLPPILRNTGGIDAIG
jgi:hypothetical protein